jgi:exodeoxyribonuclease III
MRLVIWNCAMKFDQKYRELLGLRPDVAIISECAELNVLARKAPDFIPTSTVWHGENPSKGLAVFSFGNYQLTTSRDPQTDLKYVLPVDVHGPMNFKLLATWAFMGRNDMKDGKDPGPLLRSTFTYEAEIKSGNTIMAGDFNNHPRWDRPKNPRNFADFLSRMDDLGMTSAYHKIYGLPMGEETVPTHFWRDRKINPKTNFHIDYIFAPELWVTSDAQCEVGKHKEWHHLSDHVPMVLELGHK